MFYTVLASFVLLKNIASKVNWNFELSIMLNWILTNPSEFWGMEFPQYRRYKNNQSYFKILSNEEFEEYKLNGKQMESHRFIAKILPDRNYIQDMLHDYEPYWEKIEESDLQLFLNEHLWMVLKCGVIPIILWNAA